MANIVIIAVRKDDKGVITHVKTQMEIDSKIVQGGKRTKQEVIHNITQRGILYTVGTNNTPVHVVDDRYIRTDGNNTKADNLGELPTF